MSTGDSEATHSVQTVLLAVVPKFPAILSLLGSLFIIMDVSRSKKKMQKLPNRIMLGLSCSDILASSVYFIGTWFIPRGTIGQYGPIYLASGNDATCSVSGFMTQLAICSPLYNGSLCLYYLLSIKCVWTDRSLKKIEPLLHVVPIFFAIGTSSAGLALNLYGSVEWLCWVNPVIPNPHTWIYQWSFLFVPLWIVVFFVTCVMFSLWWTMRQQELKMEQNYQVRQPESAVIGANNEFSTTAGEVLSKNIQPNGRCSDPDTAITQCETKEREQVTEMQVVADDKFDTIERNGDVEEAFKGPPRKKRARRSVRTSLRLRKRVCNINSTQKYSRRIAVQGIMYILAFYITWLFPSVQRIIELVLGKNFFVLQFLDTSLLPLQGFLNVIIFARPRYLRTRKRNPEVGFWRAMGDMIVLAARGDRNNQAMRASRSELSGSSFRF